VGGSAALGTEMAGAALVGGGLVGGDDALGAAGEAANRTALRKTRSVPPDCDASSASSAARTGSAVRAGSAIR
jgi:hypothetical protein